VTGTVAPGQTFDFKFDFHAPPTPGTYTEYFGLVEDGSVWFSDPGQGGPADTDIEANIQVMGAAGSCQADPNVPDAGPDAEPDAGTTTDAGGTTPGDAGPASGADAGQAGSGDSGGATTGTGTGAGVGTTAGDGGHLVVSDAGGVAHGGGGDASASGNVALPPTGSSGCSVGDRRGGPPGATWALGGVAILVARRRRRTATSRCSA
jgi:MYXO-CTERM domain-containing protein